MLSTLCALGLLVRDREVTREALEQMYREIGQSPPEEETTALLLLCRAFEEAGRQAKKSVAGPELGVLTDGIDALATRLAALERRIASLEGPAAPETGKEAANHDPGVPKRGEQSPDPQSPDPQPPDPELPGWYVYGIVELPPDAPVPALGPGIEDKPVELLRTAELAAVTHPCKALPYASDDPDLVKSWVEAHNAVLMDCVDKFPAVVPLAFNTILCDRRSENGGGVVLEWLREETVPMRRRIERVRGRKEYGVQAFWNPRRLAEELLSQDTEIASIREGIQGKPPGTAYLLREKLERVIQSRLESLAEKRHREFTAHLRGCSVDLRVEANKRAEGELQMIGNWSCLVHPDRVEALESVYSAIRGIPGYDARLTGPWPPYSFVG